MNIFVFADNIKSILFIYASLIVYCRRQKVIEDRLVQEEVTRRVEEMVAKRVEEELERRRDEIEAEVRRRVEDAKRQMEKQMMEEMERQRQAELDARRQREVVCCWPVVIISLSFAFFYFNIMLFVQRLLVGVGSYLIIL